MNIVYKYTICLLLFVCQIINAQTYIDNDGVILKQIINNENVIKHVKITTQVSITQIGFQNMTEVSLIKGNSTYSIYQNGIRNNIELIKPFTSFSNEEFFYQNGTNNYISQKSFYSNTISNNTIIQTGNNLSFQSYGENSISNKIVFSQSGNLGNILMFNR